MKKIKLFAFIVGALFMLQPLARADEGLFKKIEKKIVEKIEKANARDMRAAYSLMCQGDKELIDEMLKIIPDYNDATSPFQRKIGNESDFRVRIHVVDKNLLTVPVFQWVKCYPKGAWVVDDEGLRVTYYEKAFAFLVFNYSHSVLGVYVVGILPRHKSYDFWGSVRGHVVMHRAREFVVFDEPWDRTENPITGRNFDSPSHVFISRPRLEWLFGGIYASELEAKSEIELRKAAKKTKEFLFGDE